MTNVTSIEGARKPCPHCGAPRSHPDFTCPRIASVTFFDDESWRVEYVEFWGPHEEPAA